MPQDLPNLIAKKFAEYERRIASLERTPRLTNSSIDAGSLNVKDDDGAVREVVGRQSDGSYGSLVIKSPPQPTPQNFELSVGDRGAVEVSWGGEADGDVPLIHGRVEVWSQHVPEGGTIDVAQAKLRSSIRDRDGGATTIACPVPGVWAIWLRMVGQDRVTAGEFSEPLFVTVTALFDVADFETRLNAFADGELEDAAYNSLMARLGEFLLVRTDQLDANAINGMTITGGVFQSHEEPELGTKQDASGFRGYAPDGEEVFRVGVDGTVFLTGEIEARVNETASVLLSSGDISYLTLEYDNSTRTMIRGYGSTMGGLIRFRATGDTEVQAPAITWAQTGDNAGDLIISPQAGTDPVNDRAVYIPGTLRVERAGAEIFTAARLEATDMIGTYGGVNFASGYSSGSGTGPVHYIEFGDWVLLGGVIARGGSRTDWSDPMATVPAPAFPKQVPTIIFNTAGLRVPAILNIGTDGWLRVFGGSDITNGSALAVDGVMYRVGALTS